jgi:hypothetical protein
MHEVLRAAMAAALEYATAIDDRRVAPEAAMHAADVILECANRVHCST